MSAAEYLTERERREYLSLRVTLDGKPAIIRGARQPFATVSVLPGGYSVEFAWPTVARIVARDGAFRS